MCMYENETLSTLYDDLDSSQVSDIFMSLLGAARYRKLCLKIPQVFGILCAHIKLLGVFRNSYRSDDCDTFVDL